MSTQLVSRTGPSWRAVILVLAGVLVGLLAAQTVLGRVAAVGVTPAATAKWASCPGVGFYPNEGSDSYGTVAGVGRRGDSADLYCGLALPHGATVTDVKFHLYDATTSSEADDCRLIRVRLDPPTGTFQTLAGPRTTGVAFDAGYVVKFDTSISYAVIDNRHYAYAAQCHLVPDDEALQILGVTVRYLPA